MLPALLTAFCFAVTPVFASRSTRLLGPGRANLARLCAAALPLGLWFLLTHAAFPSASFPWFLLGGVVGFGIGGVSMFQALSRLGPNLCNLTVQCLSVLAAASLEWLWLGTGLSPLQMACAALAMTGVVLGLLPGSLPNLDLRTFLWGAFWALLSATAQGFGAVLSRKAFQVAKQAGELVDPGSAAFLRVLGGVLIAVLALLLEHGLRKSATRAAHHHQGRAWPWVWANALTGPILGVTCYQWALRSTPAGIVQAVVATAPLLTIPLAAWIEGERPRKLYYLAAPLAVIAIVALWLSR